MCLCVSLCVSVCICYVEVDGCLDLAAAAKPRSPAKAIDETDRACVCGQMARLANQAADTLTTNDRAR